MLIKYHNTVQEKKYLLILVIIDILKEYTSPENHMKKTELCDKIEQCCGFMPARNTVYDKLNSLEEAGFPIVQDSHDGVYYDGHELSDGELRFLVDSVLYSDFVTLGGADEMIEALTAFGSPEFQKYIRKQKLRAGKTRKNMQKSVFFTIEEVQSAIFSKRQISCNYLTYRADLTTEKVYPEDITVNPYELVYKNGRYYLLGALNDNDKILSWRVDRLCNLKKLKTRCQEIPQLKEINASGGMSAYADTQPDLCGGAVETFKIQCAKDSIDEIVDVFGCDFSIAPEQKGNYDDETIILSVKATRESMKSWAFTHAGSMVVISPDVFRKDIADSLKDAELLYRVTGKPIQHRIWSARSFSEAVRFAKIAAGKKVVYHGSSFRNLESIDLSELSDMTDTTVLLLSNCRIEHAETMKQMEMLKKLSLIHCEYPLELLDSFSGLESFQTDCIEAAVRIANLDTLVLLDSKILDLTPLIELYSLRSLSIVHNKIITDISPLKVLQNLEKLEVHDCDFIRDYSFLEEMPNLKEARITSPGFSLKDGIQLHKKTGVTVYLQNMRDLDDDTLKQLGINPKKRK